MRQRETESSSAVGSAAPQAAQTSGVGSGKGTPQDGQLDGSVPFLSMPALVSRFVTRDGCRFSRGYKVLVQKQLGGFVTALPVNHHSKREVIP
jgi:hypothetical protein